MVKTRRKDYEEQQKKPTTPPRQVTVSEQSTPGESSISSQKESRRHIWKPLLEDIEANVGINHLLGQEQHLDKLLAKLIKEDTSGTKEELYGRPRSTVRRTLRRQVLRWKEKARKGQYVAVLKTFNVIPFEKRSTNIDIESDSEDSDSDNSTIPSLKEDDIGSLESSRPSTVAPRPKKKKKKKKTDELKSPPTKTTPAAGKDRSDKNNKELTHPLPSEITLKVALKTPNKSKITSAPSPEIMLSNRTIKGTTVIIEEHIQYDPTSLNPMHAWPFWMGPVRSLEGVDEFAGEQYDGTCIFIAINPHFTSMESNRVDADEFFRCTMVKKNLLKFEIPAQSFLLAKQPEDLEIADATRAGGPLHNIMTTLYTLNKKYQDLVDKNEGKDPLIVFYLKFPDSETISAKRVNEQTPQARETGIENVTSHFTGGKEEHTAIRAGPPSPGGAVPVVNFGPFFTNSTYFAYYEVANVKLDTSFATKAAAKTATVSDVANALSALDIISRSIPISIPPPNFIRPNTSSGATSLLATVPRRNGYQEERRRQFKAQDYGVDRGSESTARNKEKRAKKIGKNRASAKPYAGDTSICRKGSFEEDRKQDFIKHQESRLDGTRRRSDQSLAKGKAKREELHQKHREKTHQSSSFNSLFSQRLTDGMTESDLRQTMQEWENFTGFGDGAQDQGNNDTASAPGVAGPPDDDDEDDLRVPGQKDEASEKEDGTE